MVRRKREAKASIVDKSREENLPAETAAAEIDVLNSVIVDAGENNIQFQSESEVQAVEQAGKENNATLVGKVDESKMDATEEEIMHEEHAAEKVEMGLGESKEGEVGKEEECHDYDNDNSYNADFVDHDNDDVYFPDDEDGDDDDDDVDEHDDDVDEHDDDVADNHDDDDFDYHDDEDGDDDGFHEDDDNDYDDEKDDMMGEEEIDENAKLEDNNSITEKSNDSQRKRVEEGKQEEKAKEENEDREHGNMKKKVQILRKGSKTKEVTTEVSDKMASGSEHKQEKEGQGDMMKEADKENAEEQNEDREDGSLKKKVKTLRTGRKRKKVRTELSDKMASKQKDLKEKDGEADRMEEADEEDAKEDIREKEQPSKQKVKKLSKSGRGKVEAGGFEKGGSKRDDKVESACRKKSSKRVKSMGMIFMCSSKTKKDCYHYKVLGLPANKKDVVGKIYKGMRLFLYDFDLKLMYGIYKAAGPGGFNVEPRAFNSQFPAQVRFTLVDDCLPVAEEKFKKVIKDNYFTKTKFDCQLTSQQVKNLCKLFVSASKGPKATRLARRQRNQMYTNQERKRARGDERQSARDEKRRYHEHNHRRGREVVAFPVAPVPGHRLPAAAPTPSHPYDKTLELDAYRRDLFLEHSDPHRHPVPEPRDAYRMEPVLEHRNVYRRDPPLHHPDSYRRDLAAEHLDLRLRDEIGRRKSYTSDRERHEHPALRSQDDFGRYDPYFDYRGSSGEIGRHDPYISYREHPAYRDRLYDTSPLPEHDHYRPISQSTAYCSAVAPLPVYGSARPLYRY